MAIRLTRTTEKIQYINFRLLNKSTGWSHPAKKNVRDRGHVPRFSLPPVLARGLFNFLLLFLLTVILPSFARAEIYTYEDDNGTVHFSNVPTDPIYSMIIPPKEATKKVSRKDMKNNRRGEFNELIMDKSNRYGLDPALVKAVIAVESDFNPLAVSEKGAMGLMQLMPLTAKDLGVSNTFDPAANVDGGTRYLRYLLDSFNWDIELALAAYHAGKSRVERHFGIPPIPATHAYVRKVKRTYSQYILH